HPAAVGCFLSTGRDSLELSTRPIMSLLSSQRHSFGKSHAHVLFATEQLPAHELLVTAELERTPQALTPF
ncbi:uncharacterized, partial [Tachysurus ichikawai]